MKYKVETIMEDDEGFVEIPENAEIIGHREITITRHVHNDLVEGDVTKVHEIVVCLVPVRELRKKGKSTDRQS